MVSGQGAEGFLDRQSKRRRMPTVPFLAVALVRTVCRPFEMSQAPFETYHVFFPVDGAFLSWSSYPAFFLPPFHAAFKFGKALTDFFLMARNIGRPTILPSSELES